MKSIEMGNEDDQVSEDSFQLEDSLAGWEFVTKQSAKQAEFLIEIETFLIESFQNGVLLEAMIATVLLKDNSFGDAFECGLAKAEHFSEHGDIQALISLLAQWCVKLHTKSQKMNSPGRKKSLEGRINVHKLRMFDQKLSSCYSEVRSLIPNMNTSLSFHTNSSYVHETLTTLMATTWPHRLCVCRGRGDLGYLQISSKSIVGIGKNSCLRFTNKPPTFSMYLDDIISNGDSSPPVAHIWIGVSDNIASVILKKLFNTTEAEVIAQHMLLPISVENIGLELGSLAISDNLGERLSLICGYSVEIFYDRDYKRLILMCSSLGQDSLKGSLHEELEKLRTKFSTSKVELPFPNLWSPIRLQIGEGFKCFGVTGFQWASDKNLSIMRTSEHVSIDSRDMKGMTLRKGGEDSLEKNHATHSLLLTEESNDQSSKDSLTVQDEAVQFPNAVTINLTYRVTLAVQTTEPCFIDKRCEPEYTKLHATRAIVQLLVESGYRQTDDTIISAKEVFDDNRVRLQVSFPNLHYAKTGITCLKSCRSISIEDIDQLDEDLKRFFVVIDADLFRLLEKPLRSKLEKFKRWKAVKDFRITNSTSKILKVRISVEISESYHLHKIDEFFSNLLEPMKINIDTREASYLTSQAGKQFLKFLMDFTDTYIHIPTFQRNVCVYGIRQKVYWTAVILGKQILKQPNDFQWHLIDLDNPYFVSDAVKMWSAEFRSKAETLQGKDMVRQCVLLKDRPELWLETTLREFESYYSDVRLKLRLVDTEMNTMTSENANRLVTCSACYDNFRISDEKCCVIGSCGHAYCTECLLGMVSSAARCRQLPVMCAFENCRKPIPASEFRSILSLYECDEQRSLISFLLEDFAAKNSSSLRMCQNPRCQGIGFYDESSQTMSCLWCRPFQWFCVFCASKAHPGEGCGASFNILHWLQKDPANRKNCPNCTITIEKIGGCNSLQCDYCKSFMCWKCAEFHDPSPSICQQHIGLCLGPRNRRRVRPRV